MKQRRVWTWTVVLWLGTCWAPSLAEEHYYVLLKPTGAHASHPAEQPYRFWSGVYRERYAYGWFGAAPRRHPDMHYGYRQNYIQWSLR
jgi:hypothetical protein